MNKKGSVIVESVMVFPVIILTLTALICMMTYFYTQLCDRVDMHIMLRAESGRLCENMYYKEINKRGFSIYKESQQIYSSYLTVSGRHASLRHREKEVSARKYIIDETAIVRRTDFIRDGMSDNDE